MTSPLLRACALVLFFAAPAWAQSYTALESYPEPAENAFGTTATALPDGRIVVWDGETVFLQALPRHDVWEPAASGYAGDPGFIALAPDGHTVLLGAGFANKAYLLDLDAPTDYVEGSEISVPTHFSGTFITESLVAMDRGKSDFSGSEIVVVDVAQSKSLEQPFVLMTLPAPETKTTIIDKPQGAYSSNVYYDEVGEFLYVMDGNAREIRAFPLWAVLDAYENETQLDWEADAAPMGEPGVYFTGGIEGITEDNNLIIPGSEGFGLPGGVQIVSVKTGAVLDVLDPVGNGGFYGAVYNAALDDLLVSEGGVMYAPEPWPTELPPPFGCALLEQQQNSDSDPASAGVVAGLLALGMAWSLRRRSRR
jgi:MYXO-CTERM domain-containing protein